MNTGLKLIAAIPDDKTDDLLADVLTSNRQRSFVDHRAMLHRILSAASTRWHLCIMRLTADNVLADGRLLDPFIRSSYHGIWAFDRSSSGLPNGALVEFSVNHHWNKLWKMSTRLILRASPQNQSWFGAKVTKKFCHFNPADMRCTIDTLEDYLFVARHLEILTSQKP